MARILVVDDEAGIRSFIAEVLEDEGHEVSEAENGAVALTHLAKKRYHLVFTDIKMPVMDGNELLRNIAKDFGDTEVIVLTAYGTVDSAVEAMKLGAFDYLQKPISGPAELRLLAQRAVERQKLKAQKAGYRAVNRERQATFVCQDEKTKAIVSKLEQVAKTTATVLIVGESGTGKEVAARYIHQKSPRCEEPFVAVNCAALSEQLLESELFGHEKGAYTGASAKRRGRFELADCGTLFLDEVAELRPELQVKLLRVLQERCFERVGGSQTIDVDVRLVAATNKDLHQAMEDGTFREDLYHRLNVFPIELPPLRQRKADIAALTTHIVESLRASLGKSKLHIEDSAIGVLESYTWPGNVRELANVLERSAIVCQDEVITAEDLTIPASKDSSRKEYGTGSAGLTGTLKEIEREAIRQALAANNGHRKKAAEQLGIALRTLYDKIKLYDL